MRRLQDWGKRLAAWYRQAIQWLGNQPAWLSLIACALGGAVIVMAWFTGDAQSVAIGGLLVTGGTMVFVVDSTRRSGSQSGLLIVLVTCGAALLVWSAQSLDWPPVALIPILVVLGIVRYLAGQQSIDAARQGKSGLKYLAIGALALTLAFGISAGYFLILL